MGYFLVSYNSRVVNYDRKGFIRLATEKKLLTNKRCHQMTCPLTRCHRAILLAKIESVPLPTFLTKWFHWRNRALKCLTILERWSLQNVPCKVTLSGRGTIDQWIRRRQPSLGPRIEPQADHIHFMPLKSYFVAIFAIVLTEGRK